MSHRSSGKLFAMGAVVLLSAPFYSSPSVAEAMQPASQQSVSCLPEHTSDGYLQDRISVTYANDSTVIITHDALECDVNVNFSSYTMPADYDGNGFYGNSTAYPQPLFDNMTQIITAGAPGAFELQIDLPDRCNNIQVDAYFGDVVTTVGPDGHGTYNLKSQVYRSNGACSTSSARTSGASTTTPTDTADSPAPVAKSAGKGAATLANTGFSPMLGYSVAFLLLVATLAVTKLVRSSTI